VASAPEQVPVTRPRQRPRLVFFHSPLSGRCRRVEGFIAQVLQRRRNHETFDLVRVSVDEHPDLAERFRIEQVPTICIVEGRKLCHTIVTPRGCRELERELEPWLR
jgi:thioredoxin-like negative regulator of GroEL